ncbi:MAG TPA: ABC transporter ATP-binding protein [Chloroflexota bacterium]|nr:ABC transporter ATP-binding protein [Chloroflexota bacterium]
MMHGPTIAYEKGPRRNKGPVDESPKGLRARIDLVRKQLRGTLAGIPQVLQLVWDASRPLTLLLAVSTILAGFIPAIQAYMAKLLINAVVKAIFLHAQHMPDRVRLNVPVLWGDIRFPVLSALGVVVVLALIQLAIAAFSALLSTLTNISQQLMQERISMSVQLLIIERAATLDLAFFENPASYDNLQIAQREATSRSVQMVSQTFGLVRTLITFFSMIALLVGLSPWLALAALLSPVPSFISNARYSWWGYAIARRNSPIRRKMTYLTTLLTTDTYAKEVKILTLGNFFIERFRGLAQQYYDDQKSIVSRRYLAGYAWSTLTTIASSGTYLYVAAQAVNGRLTLGDLTLYTQVANSVQSSFQSLLTGLSSMYENNLYLTSLFDLLKEEPKVVAPAHPVPVPNPLRGEIEFEHVSFKYAGTERYILRDVSFTIRPGETVALVGKNGAGKTTLIKLLTRLYDPTEGRILVDGYDIREFDPAEYRQQIAIMLQDYATYQLTARENIGLGRHEELANEPAIEEAAQRSGADEVVDKLPQHYNTMLGKWFDEGVNLSGGEWQKVALARAFMRDAPILILDEPTAALDAQAEFDLFGRLRALTTGHTALYISHRFSTVRMADRILMLADGELIEHGTHEELMALGGQYAHLFNLQAAAYLSDPVAAEEAARIA